jgi:transcription initiation factor TFIID subunit 10
VPDSVVQYHLSKSGVNVKDPRISRLVALAADKFLAEIIYESKQTAILKKRKQGKDKRKLEEISECLQLSDLSQALQAKRISISRRIRDDE